MEQATNETQTVEVTDITPEVTPAPALPTRAEVKAKGWSKAEMDSAEKRGLIAKTEEKPEAKPEPKADDKEFPAVQTEAKAEPVKPKTRIPDATLTPEQEKVFLETFGPGTDARAMYFGMKNNLRRAQGAEAKAKDLEARLAALESTKPTPAPLVDEQGNVIDPDNQPFTLKAWKEMQAAQAAEYERLQTEQANRHRVISEAHVAQEEYARSVYPDFDPTVNLAKEVIQNLDSLVADVNDREDVKDLIAKMQVAAAQADRIGLDERHAAMIAYRIGKFHPKYGQPAETTGQVPKANGGLTAEQMKRIEANTQRRASSASVAAGGGKRTISAEDMDLKTLTGMDFKSRSAFAKAHPDLYAKLLRG